MSVDLMKAVTLHMRVMSSGDCLLPEETFENESIENHTSATSESYIKPSNVYKKNSKKISINSDKNVDNKKLTV